MTATEYRAYLLELTTPEDRQRVDEIRASFKQDGKLTLESVMFLLDRVHEYDQSSDDILNGLKTLLGDG